ncbi:MAG: 4-hydroxythreonine-4-phosphate dehydrogenase PdxA [Ignavibacteriales bacterium CG12_big_fil_rev_8_21_14_0_65_30_8]|nr:MAG: 4-hydroxythreonine-4-phosphate dehydrogenase PdxA [Ignavibacteriales bacterium CG12_big_fil_rev_8_21_14_0_65_30_8]
MSNFIFTCGDVNGIGPEIVIKSIKRLYNSTNHKFIFITPENVFNQVSKKLKTKFPFAIVDKLPKNLTKRIYILKLNDIKIEYSKTTAASGLTSFNSIRLAFELLKKKRSVAMITAPISKKAIALAGIKYPGHTEMLADWSKAKNFSMVFLSKKMKSALVTIHTPINKIIKELTAKKLSSTFEIIIKALKKDFKIKEPKIAVLGLNPHAGEGGIIGIEEENIIIPAINKNKFKKYLSGPFSSDAFFAKHSYRKFDLVIGMYHDQVLIPFKMLNSGQGVNFTAGLPIIRTSPDHGTAFDISGKFIANESSMIEAFYFAEEIAKNRKK